MPRMPQIGALEAGQQIIWLVASSIRPRSDDVDEEARDHIIE